MTGIAGCDDTLSHLLDSHGVGHRGPAVFLNNERHCASSPSRPRQSLTAIACADPGDSLYKIFRMTDTQASVNGKIGIGD